LKIVTDDVDLLKFIGRQQSQYIRNAADFRESLCNFAEGGRKPSGDLLPWKKTHDVIDFQPGRTTVWAGLNKSGKSLVVGQAIMSWGGGVIASLEMHPDETLYRMACQFSMQAATPRDCERFLQASSGLWIYNKLGAVDRDRILGLIYYSAQELGCKHIVVDSLMKCGLGRDDYDAEKRFVESMVNAARDAGIHVHLICHMNKAGFEHTDDLIGARRFIRGAGEISDMADACIVIARNRRKEIEIEKQNAGANCDQTIINEWDALLRVDANRHYGEERTFGLSYDTRSQLYHDGGILRAVSSSSSF